MKKIFNDSGDFAATNAAEIWCAKNGVSVGTMQRNDPRGLMRGDFYIAKWRNLSQDDKNNLDGRMTGNPRSGPIAIEISE